MPFPPLHPPTELEQSATLIVTTDASLRDTLLGLCAAAGAAARVADDVATAKRLWEFPPLVVVGSDLAPQLVGIGLPRRSGVVLVGLDLDDACAWDVAVRVGAESVVFLPDADAWLVERFGNAVDGAARGCLAAVLGGRGGAGATTFAAALAVTAVRERLRCMLVDGDSLGGGIDLALGGEDSIGLRWPELSDTGGRVSSHALRAALPDLNGLALLSCDRSGGEPIPAPAMHAVLAAGRRSSDLVVVDLPRRVDPATALAIAEADVTVLLVPAEVRATAAAARVAALVAPLARDLQVVVRGPSPGGLSGPAIADALGLPLLAWLDAEPGVAHATDRGEPPARLGKGPLAQVCRDVLGRLRLDARPAA